MKQTSMNERRIGKEIIQMMEIDQTSCVNAWAHWSDNDNQQMILLQMYVFTSKETMNTWNEAKEWNYVSRKCVLPDSSRFN